MQSENILGGYWIHIGPVPISGTVITTWCTMLAIFLFAFLSTRRLRLKPSTYQAMIEGVVEIMESAIAAVAPRETKQLLPLIGSLWIFILVANLVGLIPGVHSPTRDLSTTAALAIIVFCASPWYGIRNQGLRKYFSHYLRPNPLLLPFHIVSEITRTVALAVRLFGNMMSLELAAVLVLFVAGFLVPIPILMLHIIEALVQAYIFGMLALVYIAGGLQSQQLRSEKQEK